MEARLATRFIKSMIAGRGDPWIARAHAASQTWFESGKLVDLIQKTAVGSLNMGDIADFSDAVSISMMEYIRPREVISRMQGLRRVPVNVNLQVATGGLTAYWPAAVAGAVALSKGSLTSVRMTRLPIAAIAVIDDELARVSDPSAEELVRNDAGNAIIAATDVAFLDPASTAITDARPASITAAAPSYASSGSTLAAIDSDLQALLFSLNAGGSNLSAPYFCMGQRTMIYLAALRGSGGNLAFPALSTPTPSIFSIPVLASRGIASAGSPSTSYIAAVDAAEVFITTGDLIDIGVSANAALEMSDGPSTSAESGTGASTVSMFQTQSRAVKATRWINWKPARQTAAAAVLTGVTY